MPASTRRERYPHRARWRPVPKPANLSPPSSRMALVADHQTQRGCTPSSARRLESRASGFGLDLPQLFAPAEAAEILRRLGLTEMTECALRTRAYRRQVPFHLNGRRIRFTASDLREIVEGQPRRPEPTDVTPSRPTRSEPKRRSVTRPTDHPPQAWRARRPYATPAAGEEQPG
jgi:hypothetical protein